jgi:hypothetical protein
VPAQRLRRDAGSATPRWAPARRPLSLTRTIAHTHTHTRAHTQCLSEDAGSHALLGAARVSVLPYMRARPEEAAPEAIALSAGKPRRRCRTRRALSQWRSAEGGAGALLPLRALQRVGAAL